MIVAIAMKPPAHYYRTVLFIIVYKVVLFFEACVQNPNLWEFK